MITYLRLSYLWNFYYPDDSEDLSSDEVELYGRLSEPGCFCIRARLVPHFWRLPVEKNETFIQPLVDETPYVTAPGLARMR